MASGRVWTDDLLHPKQPYYHFTTDALASQSQNAYLFQKGISGMVQLKINQIWTK